VRVAQIVPASGNIGGYGRNLPLHIQHFRYRGPALANAGSAQKQKEATIQEASFLISRVRSRL
jgi:hypothetical protein